MVVLSNTHTVQCSIIGDGMVGKTSLAQMFVGKSASDKYVATIMDNYVGKISVAGDIYDVNIVDAAGQHEYENIRMNSYEDTEVFLVCYSVIDRESFESVKSFWIPEIKNNGPKKPIILVATQTDLRNNETDCVNEKEGKRLSREIHADGYFEVSSDNKDAIRKLFSNAVLACLKQRKHKLNHIRHWFSR